MGQANRLQREAGGVNGWLLLGAGVGVIGIATAYAIAWAVALAAHHADEAERADEYRDTWRQIDRGE